ncbi:hypothetical protein AYJ54_06950 [Bradyrhizobium centrolobii]|uniref:Uncharacterized protein n=1 Tax=Bradyrhizobium centrolobii TaxID=1505087 RepID=A0A176YWY1_9BRAD|nr:hypothetical protein [Bradyrhizobium centrolobii]OAF12221.1 hypothetical protein AYJ54_06950 [Bradyrhizobium centrolobii]
MSQIYKAFFGTVAIAVTLGAVQLASGHDLADRWQAISDKPGHVVNRAGKADRLAELKPAAVTTRTVSMRLNDLADTSIVLRVPAVIETGNAKSPLLLQKQGRNKPTVACEPMVSSLTEVAKLLQPGRCVT